MNRLRLLATLVVLAAPLAALGQSCERLYLHRTQLNAIGAAAYDMDTNMASNVAAATDTTVTNATVSGTKIQMTKTAGGTAVYWITRPLTTAITISAASFTTSVYGLESATTVNAGFSSGLYRATCSTGANLATILDPTTTSTEFGTSAAVRTSAGTATSTTVSAGECLKLILYIANVGTMASGTVTVQFDSATSAANTSFVTLPTGNCLDVPSWVPQSSGMDGWQG